MTQTSSAKESRSSRYHVTSPPVRLYAILCAFAKESKGPVYRRHGGHPNSNLIRSIIKKDIPHKLREAEIDEIRRFLTNTGVLTEDASRNVWIFNPEKADELYAACEQRDRSLPRAGRSFSDMCRRDSDPDPLLTLVRRKRHESEEEHLEQAARVRDRRRYPG